MKLLVTSFIALLIGFASYGQIEFRGDSTFRKSSWTSQLTNTLDSIFSLNKDYDFEFRLWTLPSLTRYFSVFILTLRNNSWSADYFEYNGYTSAGFTKQKVNQTKLDSLWGRLVKNQVLSLPTQDSIRDKMKIFIADSSYALDEEDSYKRVMMTDGTTYRFELANREKRRSYEYHCPQGYLKHYPNIEELYRAYAIIILVRQYLGLKLTIC